MIPAMLLPTPNLYYLCCAYLARAWLIAIVQIVSFNQQQALLSLFYPDKKSFYLAIILGLPSLVTLVLNRYPKRGHPLLNRFAKAILSLSLLVDIANQIYSLNQGQLEYSLAKALVLTLSLWFLLWVITSKRLKYCWQH